MIKLEVKIEDEKFIYSYAVGDSTHNGSMTISCESLSRFTDLLRLCATHYSFEDKTWERDAIAKAWLEKQKGER